MYALVIYKSGTFFVLFFVPILIVLLRFGASAAAVIYYFNFRKYRYREGVHLLVV